MPIKTSVEGQKFEHGDQVKKTRNSFLQMIHKDLVLRWDNVIGIVIRPWAAQPKNRGLIPVRGKR